MDDIELLAFLEGHRTAAVGFRNDELAEIQKESLDRYHGLKYGDEEEGRSKVISHDVAEGVDELMPDILDLFVGNDRSVEFIPENEEDIPFSEQSTDYVNEIFWNDNNGLVVLHDMVKDGLIQRNGYIKVWWEESDAYEIERYENLSIVQLSTFENDDSVEILEHDESNLEGEDNPDILAEYSDGKLHDIKIKRSFIGGCAKDAAVPPEEILFAPQSRSIQESPYFCHRVEKTISDIIAEGLATEEEALELSGDDPDAQDRKEGRHKDESKDETPDSELTREVWVFEEYARVDINGYAELRRIIRVGDTILSNEEVPEIPFVTFTPNRMPHRISGLSTADALKEPARIKTIILRQMLDNLYFSNNPRKLISEQAIGENTVDDLLTDRIGGIVRVKGDINQMKELTVPFVAGKSFDMLEYIDRMSEKRTGITQLSRGLPDEALSDNATTTVKLMAAAESRKKLIGRFAGEALGEVYMLILKLTARHQDFKKVIKLRNEWVTIDPRTWNISKNVNIQVGLGNESFEQKMQNHTSIFAIVKEGFEAGLVPYEKMHNALTDTLEIMGKHNPGRYFPTLDEFEPPEQPPSDAEIKAQSELQQTQMKGQIDIQIAREKLAVQKEMKMTEMVLEYELEVGKAELEGMKEGAGSAIDAEIRSPLN